jgi:hypothetical protein
MVRLEILLFRFIEPPNREQGTAIVPVPFLFTSQIVSDNYLQVVRPKLHTIFIRLTGMESGVRLATFSFCFAVRMSYLLTAGHRVHPSLIL